MKHITLVLTGSLGEFALSGGRLWSSSFYFDCCYHEMVFCMAVWLTILNQYTALDSVCYNHSLKLSYFEQCFIILEKIGHGSFGEVRKLDCDLHSCIPRSELQPASALLVSVCVLCMHCWFPGIYFACTASFQVHTLRAQLVMMGLKVICCGVGANISIKWDENQFLKR